MSNVNDTMHEIIRDTILSAIFKSVCQVASVYIRNNDIHGPRAKITTKGEKYLVDHCRMVFPDYHDAPNRRLLNRMEFHPTLQPYPSDENYRPTILSLFSGFASNNGGGGVYLGNTSREISAEQHDYGRNDDKVKYTFRSTSRISAVAFRNNTVKILVSKHTLHFNPFIELQNTVLVKRPIIGVFYGISNHDVSFFAMPRIKISTIFGDKRSIVICWSKSDGRDYISFDMRKSVIDVCKELPVIVHST